MCTAFHWFHRHYSPPLFLPAPPSFVHTTEAFVRPYRHYTTRKIWRIHGDRKRACTNSLAIHFFTAFPSLACHAPTHLKDEQLSFISSTYILKVLIRSIRLYVYHFFATSLALFLRTCATHILIHTPFELHFLSFSASLFRARQRITLFFPIVLPAAFTLFLLAHPSFSLSYIRSPVYRFHCLSLSLSSSNVFLQF